MVTARGVIPSIDRVSTYGVGKVCSELHVASARVDSTACEPSSRQETGHPLIEWAKHVASCLLPLHGSTVQPASRHPTEQQGIHMKSG